MGYSCKRAKKNTPINALFKKDKLNTINKITSDIRKLNEQEKVDIMCLDESHFSTEPYVVKGWSKKGKSFFTNTKKA